MTGFCSDLCMKTVGFELLNVLSPSWCVLTILYQPQQPCWFYCWYRGFTIPLIGTVSTQILFWSICGYYYATLFSSLDWGQADPLMVISVIWSDEALNPEWGKHATVPQRLLFHHSKRQQTGFKCPMGWMGL